MWQEHYFALSGLFYFAALVPAMLSSDTEVSRWSSLPTAVAMTGSGFAYWTLDMEYPAIMMWLGAFQWAFLGILKGPRG